MYQLATKSQRYQQSPSQLLKLKASLKRDDVFDPEYLCWCFDNAVAYFGGYIESKLYKSDDPQAELEMLLKEDAPTPMSAEDQKLMLRTKLNAMLGNGALEGMKGARS